jgi:hypothetical protein
MWSSIEDVIEIAAAVIVVVAALWAVTAKFWRTAQVINRIVDSNLLERLEVLLAKDKLAAEEPDKQLNLKQAG